MKVLFLEMERYNIWGDFYPYGDLSACIFTYKIYRRVLKTFYNIKKIFKTIEIIKYYIEEI